MSASNSSVIINAAPRSRVHPGRRSLGSALRNEIVVVICVSLIWSTSIIHTQVSGIHDDRNALDLVRSVVKKIAILVIGIRTGSGAADQGGPYGTDQRVIIRVGSSCRADVGGSIIVVGYGTGGAVP